MTKQNMKAHLRWFWREWVKPLLAIALIMGAMRSSLADWNDVPSGSMKPVIQEGDRILVNKLAYDFKIPFTRFALKTWGNPERGDIVVCFSPADGIRLVKRVVALPGDQVELRDNQLWLNGKPAQYRPITAVAIHFIDHPPSPASILAEESLDQRPHPVMWLPGRPSRSTFGPLVIPEGKYFLMGDNRDNSFDSRFFGTVARDQIIGQATAVVMSLDPERHYLPRWSRWLMGLR